MTALLAWWHALTRREQWLLAVAAALFVLVIGWLGIAQPLQRGRTDAANRLATATADLGEIMAAVPMIRAAEARARAGGVNPPLETVRRRVAEAGITAESVADDGNGRVSLQIRAVKPAVLLRWIADRELQDNLVVDQLVVTRNGDATIAADIGLRGASR